MECVAGSDSLGFVSWFGFLGRKFDVARLLLRFGWRLGAAVFEEEHSTGPWSAV